ncbi:MAG: PEGA domain-containing protein [Myxococcota bacterium]
MSEPEEKDDLLSDGPSLSADGRLQQRLEAVEPPPAIPPPAVDAPLELAERTASASRAPEIADFRPDAPPPRRARPLAARLVLGLVAIALGALIVLLLLQPQLVAHRSPDGVSEPTVLEKLNLGERAPVLIESSPPGAKLTIDGEVVGETPWAGDNRWSGTVPVRLEAPGYRPWEGTLEGGKSVTLNARLKK